MIICVTGPFLRKEEILPAFSHEPVILMQNSSHFNTKFIIFTAKFISFGYKIYHL